MVRKVAVIMGSDSDWPVVKGACAQLKALEWLDTMGSPDDVPPIDR